MYVRFSAYTWLSAETKAFKAAARLAQFGERRVAQREDVASNPNRKNDQGLLQARSNGRHAIVVALQKNFESKWIKKEENEWMNE